jgi:Icc-related predicted phosphoesterase
MRLWIFSDLHLEFAPLQEELLPPRADVCVVAGDILPRGGAPTVRWLAENVAIHMPVVFVCGNHEFYRGFLIEGLRETAMEAALHPNLHFLEETIVELGGVIFAGLTLWTDFELMEETPREIAMRHARDVMWDYSRINFEKTPFAKLRPFHTLRKHLSGREFLRRFLEVSRSEQAVVVTHHAPSRFSIPAQFRHDLASAAYASNLDEMIEERGPSVWIHGHVHQRLDYSIGRTRILCNPRGYPDEQVFDNFNHQLVIEI